MNGWFYDDHRACRANFEKQERARVLLTGDRNQFLDQNNLLQAERKLLVDKTEKLDTELRAKSEEMANLATSLGEKITNSVPKKDFLFVKNRNDKLQATVDAAINTEKRLRTSLADAKSETDSIKAALVKEAARRAELEKTNQQITAKLKDAEKKLTEDRHELLNRISRCEAEKVKLTMRNNAEDVEFRQIQSLLVMSRESLQKAERECTRLRASLAIANDTNKHHEHQKRQKVRDLESVRHRLIAERMEVQSKYEAQSLLVVDLQKQIRNAVDEKEYWHCHVKRHENEAKAASKKYKQAIDSVNNQLASADEDKAELKDQISQLKGQLASAEEDEEELEDQIDQLKGQLAAADKDKARLKYLFDQSEARVEDLDEEIRKIQTESLEHEDLIRQLRMDMYERDITVEKLRVDKWRISRLEKANTELEKANTELEKANTELEEANTELEGANTELERRCEELTRELEGFEHVDDDEFPHEWETEENHEWDNEEEDHEWDNEEEDHKWDNDQDVVADEPNEEAEDLMEQSQTQAPFESESQINDEDVSYEHADEEAGRDEKCEHQEAADEEENWVEV
ncbi:hypothetical protein V8F06_010985 [Rhypophila decipiens]